MVGFDFRWKMFLYCIMTCTVILITTVYWPGPDLTYAEPLPRDYSRLLPWNIDRESIARTETKAKMSMLAKVIHKARKHARGSKTSDYLTTAMYIMNSLLKDINVDAKRLYERSSIKPTNLCSETFMGGAFGFPLYYKGFEKGICSHEVSISQLVTIMKYINVKPDTVEPTLTGLKIFLSSVYDTISDVKTLIVLNYAKFSSKLKTKYPHINIIYSNNSSEGAALNTYINEVKTPYVLIARDIDILTNDSRVERLVREIESLDVVATGGSFRDPAGHWQKGCFQSVYRNYSLKYIAGYDESFHECVFCDYIHGPFVTTTRYLKENMFRHFNGSNGLYEDWFLRIFQKEHETLVCPDSMFHVNIETAETDANWNKFAKTWKLFNILTPKGYTVTKRCERQEISRRPSQSLSPCDLYLNNNAVKLIMRTCEETGITCELEDGTALGAIKLEKALPWDIDLDVRYLAGNCSACQRLERALKNVGINISGGKFASTCCIRKLREDERTFFTVRYKGYPGDFHGHRVMDSDLLLKAGLAPTKAKLDGQWVNVPRNPALFLRNKYGPEIFQHAEHWRYTGVDKMNVRSNYKTNQFLPCREPGGHDCLDRYNADGDLSFAAQLP